VIADRMPFGKDSARQFWESFGVSADQEEGGPDAEGGEQVQVSWCQFGMWAVVER
jgi:hypothetical protein